MSKLLITNAVVVGTERLFENHAVLCENGKIVKICPAEQTKTNGGDSTIDAQGKYLAAGFIDLHIHGLLKYLIDDGPEDLAAISKLLPRYGVTGFLPTVCPLPKGRDAEFLSSLAKTKAAGAEILGFHLEGPFLSRTGALPPEALGGDDSGRVNNLILAAKPYKAIFSISPEFENICGLIPLMSKNNTPVFITHTAANVKQTQAAIEAGARHATHFYDVFPCPEENDPGVRPCGTVEAILADSRVSVDFILDGEHVDPVAVKMALACKGPDRVCLITDANKGAGLPPGRYKAVGGEVEFKYPGAPARLTENTGCPGGLAGSGLTMDLAVRNAVKMLGIDIPLAVRMAGANPAGVLGLKDKGRIEPGFDADMILLDRDLNICMTWVCGERCYRK